jgi:hypothetical protein
MENPEVKNLVALEKSHFVFFCFPVFAMSEGGQKLAK